MELEQIVHDVRHASQRLHSVIGPWDVTTQVAHLAGVVGRLTDDVLAIEGALALPVEDGRLARNIADALFHLIRLSNAYHVDLEEAWAQFIEQGRSQLSQEAVVTALRDTVRQNRQRRQRG